MNRIRWNPFLGEWVIMTPRRSKRPFAPRDCPFCIKPGESWVVKTLPNAYPSLVPEPEHVEILNSPIFKQKPAIGECRVIIESPFHYEQIEFMTHEHVIEIIKEFKKQFIELSEKEFTEYVFIFENRGQKVGVSQLHPHAQAYALPFTPPRIEKELFEFKKFYELEQRCLLCSVLDEEIKNKSRIITESEYFVSLIPFFARLPYEVHVYPKRHFQWIEELTSNEEEDLAFVIQDTIKRYAKVFDDMAYIMAFHNAPSKGEYPFYHFHVEFYPPWRDPNALKYLGGLETGSWTYTNDSLPEEKAKELREALS